MLVLVSSQTPVPLGEDENRLYVIRRTANLRTNIMDFRGFDSSIILMLRGGIPWPMGNFLQSLSQAILVGIILVGRFDIQHT